MLRACEAEPEPCAILERAESEWEPLSMEGWQPWRASESSARTDRLPALCSPLPVCIQPTPVSDDPQRSADEAPPGIARAWPGRNTAISLFILTLCGRGPDLSLCALPHPRPPAEHIPSSSAPLQRTYPAPGAARARACAAVVPRADGIAHGPCGDLAPPRFPAHDPPQYADNQVCRRR